MTITPPLPAFVEMGFQLPARTFVRRSTMYEPPTNPVNDKPKAAPVLMTVITGGTMEVTTVRFAFGLRVEPKLLPTITSYAPASSGATPLIEYLAPTAP